MFKNPFLNASIASLYIVGLVLAVNKVSSYLPQKDTLLAPMTMLSLLVLSVSIMGILFVYEPARLFLENKRQEALSFFLKTVGTFACFVAVLILILVFTSVL